MDYLQYSDELDFSDSFDEQFVLNLIINGLPSIPEMKLDEATRYNKF